MSWNSPRFTAYRAQREQLAKDLLRKGIADPRVLQAIRLVPRHIFVPERLRGQAYGDHALPLGEDQTISQPWVVARMTELLQVGPQDSVLEIGTGSGYQTTVLAVLARVVFSIERVHRLAQDAIVRMRELGLDNVKIQVFDGTVGWSQFAPYDRVIVTAGAPHAPTRLLEQLAIGGLLVIPEGDRDTQRLVVYERGAEDDYVRKAYEEVAFVPLIGRDGWPA